MSSLRTPAVAGRFYPGRADELLRDVLKYTPSVPESKTISAIGCIAPHAGYMYSGSVAGRVDSPLEITAPLGTVCAHPTGKGACPTHTGRGRPLAIMANTTGQTPLGAVPADENIGAQLLQRFPPMEEDSAAHRYEHAIEVQLPFLQARRDAQRA